MFCYANIFILLAEMLFLIQESKGFSCYQCTNIPGFFNKTQKGCGESSPGNSLLTKCKGFPTSPSVFSSNVSVSDSKSTIESSYSQVIHGMQMHQIGMNSSSNSRLGLDQLTTADEDKTDWFCFKAVAEVDDQEIVIRGCIPAISSDLPDKCEHMDYEYQVIGNLTFKKSLICFCDSEGCNQSDKSTTASIICIVVSLLFTTYAFMK